MSNRDSALEVGPQVPYEPELAAALEMVLPQIHHLVDLDSIPELRTGTEAFSLPEEALRRGGAIDVQQHSVPGPPGAPDVPILVLRPASLTGPAPLFFHTHGGAMVAGNARTMSEDLLDWAREFGAVLVSPDYRLAPETPHPGPVEDCYAALTWAVAHANDLGIDASRVVLMGASAGGGLAAALALLSRDRGGPEIAAQVLLCPMLDDRHVTASSIQEDGRGSWDRSQSLIAWSALLGDDAGGASVSPYAAPARATDLANLPPSYIDVGSAEPFRDEATAYASAIWAAGGVAELHVYAGGYHGYENIAPQAAISQDTKAARLRWLRRTLDN